MKSFCTICLIVTANARRWVLVNDWLGGGNSLVSCYLLVLHRDRPKLAKRDGRFPVNFSVDDNTRAATFIATRGADFGGIHKKAPLM